jgi:hypothetical protein
MITSATEPTDLAPAPADLTPGTRFRRIGGGLSVLASGTLVCASLLMIPYENQTDEAYLQTGVDYTSNILWAMVVLHYGFLLLLPAALTLVRLARRHNPKTALVAMVLAGLGAGLSGLVAVDAYDVALANSLPMDEALRIFNVAGGYGQGALIALPSILGVAVGTNLAMFAAWRARAIPLIPVVLSVVGWLIFTFFSGDAWLPSIGTAMVTVGMIWAGVIVLKLRDQVWNRL